MHIPVLLNEILESLNPQSNENFIDCTLNGGGHTKEILKRIAPEGKVLGIEWDKEIYENIQKQNIDRLIAVNDSYANLKNIVDAKEFKNISGILFDLGMSSYQIDEQQKGFSFLKNEPLLMAYGNTGRTAAQVVNEYSENDLEKIIEEYGEENFARKIAKKIIETRKIKPIKTTFELVEAIKQGIPPQYRNQKIHFATRTFQAIRIEVNEELKNIETVLPQSIEVLNPGGRLAIISFHSLEDRIVKNFFKDQEKQNKIKIITEKPITATEEELLNNPRARSSKLRVATRL